MFALAGSGSDFLDCLCLFLLAQVHYNIMHTQQGWMGVEG